MEIPAEGSPVHTRVLAVGVDQGGPGEVLASGHLLDLRKRGLVAMAGQLQTAGVIHDMKVRAAVDVAGPSITRMDAQQDSVAFEATPATGGECCRDPIRRIEALKGAPLDALVPRRLSEAIGGVRGCSHLLTLAQLLCSTTATGLAHDRARHGGLPERRPGQRLYDRSLVLDAGLGDGVLFAGIQLADVHFEPAAEDADAIDQLASHHEVRIHAEVALDSMTLRAVRAGERRNSAEAAGEWADRGATLAPLVGQGALAGMAAALFELLSEREPDRPLLDALLNLAPLLIQSMAALLDRSQTGGMGSAMQSSSGYRGGSCYMTRPDGPMLRDTRPRAPDA